MHTCAGRGYTGGFAIENLRNPLRLEREGSPWCILIKYTYFQCEQRLRFFCAIFHYMETSPEKPNIYGYYDYRRYLSDLFLYYKHTMSVFSHRYIINKAGLKSPNALKAVMIGKRHLTPSSAERFADAFRMDVDEKKYFLLLVRFSLAETLSEKEKCLQEVAMLKGAADVMRLSDEYYDVLEKWWHLPIREIVCLPDAKKSSKWIARAIQPNITPAQVAQSLQLLKKLGLIKKQGDDWKAVHPTIHTDSEVATVKASNFHRQMMRLGEEAITRFQADKREISGTVLRISKKDVAKFKELLGDFRKQLLNLAEQSENADQVYQLNIQFFPLVKPERPRRLKQEGGTSHV